MYQLAAEGGHSAAMWRLGELFEYGRGVAQDDTAALQWYRRAAEAGYVQGQAALALLVEDGRGCERDDAEALRWHLAAAEQGHALSQYCAACCLAEGRGTDKDVEAAERWLRLSASAGFEPAAQLLKESRRWEHEPESSTEGHFGEESDSTEAYPLLGIAERIAKQLRDLEEGDAAAVLDELLTEVPGLFEALAQDGEAPDSDHEGHAEVLPRSGIAAAAA